MTNEFYGGRVQIDASNCGSAKKKHKQKNIFWKQFYFLEGAYKQKQDAEAQKNQAITKNMLFYSIKSHIAWLFNTVT